MEKEADEFWLFGYGSLIWKPPPHFGEFQAMLKAMFGDFGSEDHRGTPEAPGRVATLIERSHWETLGDQYTTPEERVWGAAYRIEASRVAEVKDYLDIREINGYSIQYTPFHPGDGGDQFSCLVYIGLPDNPQFVGVQEPQALAEHIARSKGPSGPNDEYLMMLETALHDLGDDSRDKHIEDLANRVRKVQAKSAKQTTREAIEHEAERIITGSAHGRQEEIDKA